MSAAIIFVKNASGAAIVVNANWRWMKTLRRRPRLSAA
jgi:hypothetical protein